MGNSQLVVVKQGLQVARRKKHSTLTAGVYHPEPEAYSTDYYGVIVDGRPYLLFSCTEDKDAREKAEKIAGSENFRTLLEATATSCDRIQVQLVQGSEIDWGAEHVLISASRSGDFETGTLRTGQLKAILVSGSHEAVADTLCIDSALASLLDENFPVVSDPDALPALTDQDEKRSLGMLEARKHPSAAH